jgi:hypothetical protein
MRRFPRAKWVLPTTIKPATSTCWRVPVPDDPFHRAAFLGALANLGAAFQWQDDVTHSAKDVARVWRDIVDDLKRCGPSTILVGGADGDENMIRQNPENPCELQTSIDGANWCTFADFSKCLPAPQQPGGGTTQPATGGGTACYEANMPASGQWYLPTIVSTGDQLDLQNATGAGSDGGVSWLCPSGNVFFAGACIGGTGTTFGGDPLNTVFRMRLIYLIDGVYYDAMAGPFTVPGGILNKPVIVQVNDDPIGDNFGSYQFKVCVTNNGSGIFSHTFNFVTGDGGWLLIHSTTDRAKYTLGVGWQSIFQFAGNELRIYKPGLPSRSYTNVSVTYTIATDPLVTNNFGSCDADGTNPGFQYAMTPSGAGTNIVTTGAGSPFTTTNLRVDQYANASGNQHDITITSMTISGVGADPF